MTITLKIYNPRNNNPGKIYTYIHTPKNEGLKSLRLTESTLSK